MQQAEEEFLIMNRMTRSAVSLACVPLAVCHLVSSLAFILYKLSLPCLSGTKMETAGKRRQFFHRVPVVQVPFPTAFFLLSSFQLLSFCCPHLLLACTQAKIIQIPSPLSPACLLVSPALHSPVISSSLVSAVDVVVVVLFFFVDVQSFRPRDRLSSYVSAAADVDADLRPRRRCRHCC